MTFKERLSNFLIIKSKAMHFFAEEKLLSKTKENIKTDSLNNDNNTKIKNLQQI